MLKLSRVSLEWALQQALNYGDTDIFPELFEFKAVEHDWGNIAQWLMEENILNWNVRPNRHLLIPKHRYGFRISTQLDPIDFLVFTALVYEIGIDIEGRRIPKTDNIVHSYRFDPKPDGLMFDKTYHYGTFQAQSRVLAEESRCNWVVTADIADFFPRLYHHRVKNSLSNCTNKTNHALAIDRLLSNWNESYSYGIPVGCAASRLIAENALDDIDKALLSEGTTFARFSDDYRIFCSTKREACEKLAFLAYVLFENHGLTLQQHKTRIISRETFLDIACTEEEAEINQMWQKYEKLASELGLSSFYDDIEWDNLSEEQQEKISELNLNELLDEQAVLDEINIPMTRFILRRLAQMGSSDSFNQVVDNIDNLYPVIPDVVKYVKAMRNIEAQEKHTIGKRILDLLRGSTVSHLEFNRIWLLNLFTEGTEYDNENRFTSMFSEWPDHFTQREIILALGRAQKDEWFRMRKRNVFDFSNWTRRALLMAGSCLPTDERKHWYQSLESRLDHLEKAVIKWARQNPF